MIVASRIVLALLGALGAVSAGIALDLQDRFDSASYSYAAFGFVVLLTTIVGWAVGGLVGKLLQRGFRRVERAAQARSAGELTVGAVGLLVGLLVSALLYIPLHILPYIGVWVMLPMFLVIGYLFAFTAARKHRGILRLVGVHTFSDGSEAGSPVIRETLVDTSAIIDGRIADIARTGFIQGELVVPEFVLKELQQVADSSDPLKRARGRRGLEVVQDLRSDVAVSTPEVDVPGVDDVDAKLLKLAKDRGVPILTTDFNLNRLAQIQDVQVLNVNDLANALKPAVLPGEHLDVKVIREGKESGQGVGYLDDGTMVVVESGSECVGRVLGELQHIADDSDPARRSRGRRGLDVLSVLQKDHRIDLELTDEDAPETKAVDAKLVALARARGAAVLTTDYNLNRVAQLQGVRVMNLNQLANAMKPAFLPGEEMRVKVIQQGKEPGQGVAFLDDGTMIVVEGGGSHLQNEIDVVVTRVLQTVAGRMVFANISAI
jgi:uncharacterized protein YacL